MAEPQDTAWRGGGLTTEHQAAMLVPFEGQLTWLLGAIGCRYDWMNLMMYLYFESSETSR